MRLLNPRYKTLNCSEMMSPFIGTCAQLISTSPYVVLIYKAEICQCFHFVCFFFCCIHGICNVEVTCMLYYACFFFWLAAIETLVELFYNLLLLACVGVQILQTSRPFLSNLRLIAV